MTPRILLSSLVLILVLALASCVAFQRQPGVALSSSPAGARVLVDGRDSGYVTPCHLRLPREPQRIDMELEGYLPTTVLLETDTEMFLIYWREASLTENTFKFPLFLNMDDFLRPIKVQRGLEPMRIFVPLESVAR